MRRNLRPIARDIAGDNIDWYMLAYMRAAERIRQELKKPTGLNIDRLWRRLQAIYDKIEPPLEHEWQRREAKHRANTAINRCITDHGLPKTCRVDLEKRRSSTESTNSGKPAGWERTSA